MAPVAQSDIDMESRTSDQESLHRQFSEPLHAPSTSTQTYHSPAPVTHQAKCPWCGEYFQASNEDPLLHDEGLKEHIATVHPHLAKASMHDDAGGDDAENGQLDDEQNDEDDEYVEEHQENGGEGDVANGDDVEAEDGMAEGLRANEEADSEDDEDDDQSAAPDLGTDSEADFGMEDDVHGRREFLSGEKRLYKRWNIHDPRNFSKEYDDATAELDENWGRAFREAKSSKKRDASELPERPDPYKKLQADRGKFLEMTPIEDFLVEMRDPEMRTQEELYAITANAARALSTWQDEYFAVDQLYKLSTGQYEKLAIDPRKRVEDPGLAAEMQEAMLYQYRHDAGKHKKGQDQDPWIQGGFRPTPTQVRKALKTIKCDPSITPNIDGWNALRNFGVEYVPKYQDPPPEDAPSKATRTRKAAEMEAAAAADEAAQQAAAEDDEFPAKRQTRSSRFVQESVDGHEPSSPKAARGSGRGRGQGRGQGRGRGRGRGAASTPSGHPSETPTLAAVSTPPTTRGRGRGSGIGRGNARGGARGRGKGRAPSTPIATPQQMSPAPPTPAPFSRPTSVAPTPSHLAPIEPMPNGGFSMAPHQGSPTESMYDMPEQVDPAEMERRERARAEKIANSKNPRRTEAMLNHWARFNRAGRIRNPKRSKDEIEASRADTKSSSPNPSGRKRKSPSFSSGTTMINPGIAPAPGPIPPPAAAPTQLPPALTQGPPSGPLPGSGPSLPMPTHTSLHAPGTPLGPGGPLAPHPPQHRYTTPYPPHFGAIDPRGIAPYPSGPFQPPPPQPAYQTPYPEYFLPYGAAPGHGLPPPGHARRPAFQNT